MSGETHRTVKGAAHGSASEIESQAPLAADPDHAAELQDIVQSVARLRRWSRFSVLWIVAACLCVFIAILSTGLLSRVEARHSSPIDPLAVDSIDSILAKEVAELRRENAELQRKNDELKRAAESREVSLRLGDGDVRTSHASIGAMEPPLPVAPGVAALIPDAGSPLPAGAASPSVAAAPPTATRYADLVSAAQRLAKFSCSSAVRIYETAIDVNPRGVEAPTGLGRCLLELKEYDRAIYNFRVALAISPQNPEALIGAADAYKLKGNVPVAIALYKEYLEAAPRGPRAEAAKSALARLSPGEQTSDDPLGTGNPK